MKPLNLSLDAFCAWLCEHENVCVGHPLYCFNSPLALWISELSGQVIVVDGPLYGHDRLVRTHWQPLPRWARLFVVALESSFHRPVTGAEALEVLAQLELRLHASRPFGRAA